MTEEYPGEANDKDKILNGDSDYHETLRHEVREKKKKKKSEEVKI